MEGKVKWREGERRWSEGFGLLKNLRVASPMNHLDVCRLFNKNTPVRIKG